VVLSTSQSIARRRIFSFSGYVAESYAKNLIEMEKVSKMSAKERYNSPQVIAHLEAQLQDRQQQLQVCCIDTRARKPARCAQLLSLKFTESRDKI
jgi:hypothetical protein